MNITLIFRFFILGSTPSVTNRNLRVFNPQNQAYPDGEINQYVLITGRSYNKLKSKA